MGGGFWPAMVSAEWWSVFSFLFLTEPCVFREEGPPFLMSSPASPPSIHSSGLSWSAEDVNGIAMNDLRRMSSALAEVKHEEEKSIPCVFELITNNMNFFPHKLDSGPPPSALQQFAWSPAFLGDWSAYLLPGPTLRSIHFVSTGEELELSFDWLILLQTVSVLIVSRNSADMDYFFLIVLWMCWLLLSSVDVLLSFLTWKTPACFVIFILLTERHWV